MNQFLTIRRLIGVTAVVVILIGTLRAGASLRNFPDPQGPRRVGSFATESPHDGDALRVVTWNISFAEQIEQAIVELQAHEELADADVILLQEMDEAGAEAIAKELGYNYVYYPASVHRHGRSFGNAVLSLWPILDTDKLVLPHQNLTNDQIRIAVRADLEIGDEVVPVHSVHTETVLAGLGKQREQHQFLADSVGAGAPYVIVGGDFNTLTPASVTNLEDMWAELGFVRASEDAGRSYSIGPVAGVTFDHIFTRGFTTVGSGIVDDTTASDHDPLWVELRFGD